MSTVPANLSPAPTPRVSVVIPTYNRRDEVADCVESVLRSTYPDLDVIVVDNASTDGTAEALTRRFGERIKLIVSPVNRFAGGGRNLGAASASGDYLLFIDSDNIIDPRMIEELVLGLRGPHDIKIGLCGPMIYYHSLPDRLCGVEWDINMWTSRTWWKGVGLRDQGQFEGQPYLPVGHMPNIFMLSRQLFDEVGGIDPDYVIHYEESDLAEKVKRRGYRVVLFPKARTWHRISPEKVGDAHFSGNNPKRLYYSVRNRILFMKKNTGGLKKIVFLAVFAQLFLVYNLVMVARHHRTDLAGLVLKAHWDGLTFSVKESA